MSKRIDTKDALNMIESNTSIELYKSEWDSLELIIDKIIRLVEIQTIEDVVEDYMEDSGYDVVCDLSDNLNEKVQYLKSTLVK